MSITRIEKISWNMKQSILFHVDLLYLGIIHCVKVNVILHIKCLRFFSLKKIQYRQGGNKSYSKVSWCELFDNAHLHMLFMFMFNDVKRLYWLASIDTNICSSVSSIKKFMTELHNFWESNLVINENKLLFISSIVSCYNTTINQVHSSWLD